MAGEHEIPLEPLGAPVLLALILDGREAAAVPSFRIGTGPWQVLRAVPDGPVVVTNPSSAPMTVEVAQASSVGALGRWVAGIGTEVVLETREIPPGKSHSIAAAAPLMAIRHTAGQAGVVRPVGVVARGPATAAIGESVTVTVFLP